MSEHIETIREALDLGLQAWRTTESRSRFHDAFSALDALAAEVERLRREVDAQMQSKLDAQSLLANIVEAIGLDRGDFDLSDTWRTVGPRIIARLTEIVDAAEAAEAENERLREALERAERMAQEAMNELGVPSDDYPAPVAHAYSILENIVRYGGPEAALDQTKDEA